MYVAFVVHCSYSLIENTFIEKFLTIGLLGFENSVLLTVLFSV